MSATAQQVLIEFIPDTSQLDAAEDKLANLGKIDKKSQAIFKATNDELRNRAKLTDQATLSVSKEQAVVNKLVSSLKNLSGESKTSVQNLLKLSTSEIVEGFAQAAVNVDDFVDALKAADEAGQQNTQTTKATEKATVSLKAQLRAMVEELGRMKVAGLDSTEAYRQLAQEAGDLSDAIGDTRDEIKRLGSDTGVFEGLIGGVQGLAGGFAVAQGAAALFGASSEELQETLVKVSAVTAVLQGLQEIQNTLQAESAASLLIMNLQRKIQNAQLVVETALQSRSVIVRGAATVAQRLLNAAMAANPIGIVITALATAIGLFALYANGAKDAARQQAALNGALKEASEGLDGDIEGIKRAGKARLSELETAGAKQSDILRANAQTEVLIQEERLKAIAKLDKQIAANRQVSDENDVKSLQALQDKRFQLSQESKDAELEIENKNREGRKQILLESLEDAVNIKQAELDKILSMGGKNGSREFEAQKQLLRASAALEIQNAGENAAKVFAIQSRLKEDLHQLGIQAREQENKSTLAALETQLTKAQEKRIQITERESQEEINIRKQIIAANAKFEAEQEGLSEKQRTAIRVKALQDIASLQRDFDKKTFEESMQDQISLNEAQLQQVDISERDKLDLRIQNIIAAASIEEEQNKGLSAKIKEINAKRDADIKALRLQSIQDTLAFELKSNETAFAAENRAIDKQLAAQDELRAAPNIRERKRLETLLGVKKLSLDQETALVDAQARHALDGIEKERNALTESFKEKLISAKEYQQYEAELSDKSLKVIEDAEEKKKRLAKGTADYQKQLDKQRIDLAIDIAGQVAGVLSNLASLEAERNSQKIEGEKKKINDLRAAGAISEKESIDRLKKVDAEERKLKYQAAVKDKELAIFNAVIATAAGIAKASPVIPLMALAGVLGAAQIAIIAARPIPKFAKGKKDSYTGLGQVGEAGSELIESNGQMYIAKRPTIIWLGAKDKVYNPRETKEIMNRQIPTANKQVMVKVGDNKSNLNIDYDKLGKAVGKHTSMTLNVDGWKAFVKEQNDYTTFLNHHGGF